MADADRRLSRSLHPPQRAAAGQRDRPVEEDQQRETEGTAYQHDYNPTGFYRTQDKDAEQQQARGREDEHGMER